MAYDDQFWRAVADYAVLFPDVGSLGTSNATWLTEYNRVKRTAFAAVLINSSGTEGGTTAGLRNFPQETLIDALHCRRYDLNNAYVLPAHLADYPSALVVRRRGARGYRIRFGGGC